MGSTRGQAELDAPSAKVGQVLPKTRGGVQLGKWVRSSGDLGAPERPKGIGSRTAPVPRSTVEEDASNPYKRRHARPSVSREKERTKLDRTPAAREGRGDEGKNKKPELSQEA